PGPTRGWRRNAGLRDSSRYLLLPLVERRLDDPRARLAPADVHGELLADVAGGRRQQREPDGPAERGGMRAGRDDAGAGGGLRGVAVPRDPAIAHLEADEPARDSLGLLLLERAAAEEIALLHLDDPAQVRLPRRDRVVDVVAVERHLRLEAQRVSRSEAAGLDSLGLARLQQRAKDLLRRFGRKIKLEA